jgi:hypothetical protein
MRFERRQFFLVKVSGCEAETGEWFSCCSPLDRRSWASAKRDLCENFAGSANFGKLLHDAISYNSEKCPTYGFCGRMKLQKLNVLRVPFIQGHPCEFNLLRYQRRRFAGTSVPD